MCGDRILYEELNHKLRIKYFLDPIFALIFLVLCLPLLLLLTLFVLIDGCIHPHHRGPVFHLEPRITAGKIFKIIKFRTITMLEVNEINKSPQNKSISSGIHKTCAGKFILRWYLDELPQLLNILRGDMTWVGPRPHILSQYEDEIKKGYLSRKYLKAGLLGIPQACKRHPKYQMIFERMARSHKSDTTVLSTLDGLYMRECLTKSVGHILLFDMVIIARCLVVVLRGGG
jgi:lipopolysaccharide/colanic/teichoic acid biosynthesis glycosyltransferase